MWAIYWRSTSIIILLIFFTTFLQQQVNFLSLVSNSNYHPVVFWGLNGMLFSIARLFNSNGLIYFLWGYRLEGDKRFWRKLNFSTLCFFIGLALLAPAVYATAGPEIWAKYKLYGQPAIILIFPLVLAKQLTTKNELRVN